MTREPPLSVDHVMQSVAAEFGGGEGDGWSSLNDLIQPALQASRDPNDAVLAAARVYATEEGRALFEHLFDITLRLPTYDPDLLRAGRDAAHDNTLFRHGQNSIAVHLCTLIARASQLEAEENAS